MNRTDTTIYNSDWIVNKFWITTNIYTQHWRRILLLYIFKFIMNFNTFHYNDKNTKGITLPRLSFFRKKKNKTKMSKYMTNDQR